MKICKCGHNSSSHSYSESSHCMKCSCCAFVLKPFIDKQPTLTEWLFDECHKHDTIQGNRIRYDTVIEIYKRIKSGEFRGL